MKNIITYIVIFCLLSCSKDEPQNNQNFINIKLTFSELIIHYKNNYSFSDFKIKIYENKEDYLNEVNPIFSDNFDNTGTISVSDNIEDKSYYVDIFTEDKVLSNWQVTNLDVGSSNIIVFSPHIGKTDFYNTVYIEDDRKIVGEWSFTSYQFTNPDIPERTDKFTLSVNKDFTFQSFESYNGIDYVLNFKMPKYGNIELIDIKPNSQGYPASTTNSDELSLHVNGSDILTFFNYSRDMVLYSRK